MRAAASQREDEIVGCGRRRRVDRQADRRYLGRSALDQRHTQVLGCAVAVLERRFVPRVVTVFVMMPATGVVVGELVVSVLAPLVPMAVLVLPSSLVLMAVLLSVAVLVSVPMLVRALVLMAVRVLGLSEVNQGVQPRNPDPREGNGNETRPRPQCPPARAAALRHHVLHDSR